jgi:hypothetical protein
MIIPCQPRFYLYIGWRRKHLFWSKDKSLNQSRAAMQASYGLEGPQPKQTDPTSAISPNRDTRAHQAATQPKLKSVGARARSAEPAQPVRPGATGLYI